MKIRHFIVSGAPIPPSASGSTWLLVIIKSVLLGIALVLRGLWYVRRWWLAVASRNVFPPFGSCTLNSLEVAREDTASVYPFIHHYLARNSLHYMSPYCLSRWFPACTLWPGALQCVQVTPFQYWDPPEALCICDTLTLVN